MLFGELQLQEDQPWIAQHSAVTLAWAQAKVLYTFLGLNILAYERAYGTIVVPPAFLPDGVGEETDAHNTS